MAWGDDKISTASAGKLLLNTNLLFEWLPNQGNKGVD